MSFENKVSIDCAFVRFRIFDIPHAFPLEEAIGFVKGLITTTEKTKLVFKDILTSRATLSTKDNNGTLSLCMYAFKRNLNCDQFLEIMQKQIDQRTLSNEAWMRNIKIFDFIPSKL